MADTPHLLQVEGIKGECKESKYLTWINIESFSWGISNEVTTKGTARSAGVPDFASFTVTKPTDKASPKLFLACSSGQHFKSAKVVFRRMGKAVTAGQPSALEEFFEWTFGDVMVSSYQNGGSDQAVASESVSFSAASVSLNYFVMKNGQRTGGVMAGYDIRKITESIGT
ncbi:MAG: type VI secretion system tube protein Hcp [Paludibaculum sp.]